MVTGENCACMGVQGRLLVSNEIIATKRAEPMIDQIIGKLVLPIRIEKSSGNPIWRANHIPNTAPTNPSAIETKQPPREKPPIA